MKRAGAIGGIIAACAACCAIPFLLPVVGMTVFGGGLIFGFRWDQILCAMGAALAVILVARALRSSKPKVCPTDGSCGCKAQD